MDFYCSRCHHCYDQFNRSITTICPLKHIVCASCSEQMEKNNEQCPQCYRQISGAPNQNFYQCQQNAHQYIRNYAIFPEHKQLNIKDEQQNSQNMSMEQLRQQNQNMKQKIQLQKLHMNQQQFQLQKIKLENEKLQNINQQKKQQANATTNQKYNSNFYYKCKNNKKCVICSILPLVFVSIITALIAIMVKSQDCSFFGKVTCTTTSNQYCCYNNCQKHYIGQCQPLWLLKNPILVSGIFGGILSLLGTIISTICACKTFKQFNY